MARSTIYSLEGCEMSIEKAIELRGAARLRKNDKPDFRCMECGRSAPPHNVGGVICAHVEYLKRDPNCRLSDPAR